MEKDSEMERNSIFISIVIPVYNEEKRIESFLSHVIDYLFKKDFSYEIVIVNDGSRDATIDVAESLLKDRLAGRYKIIELPENRGKGGALSKGMVEASGDYVFFMDADGSTAIEEIDGFIPQFSPDYDIYIATRSLKDKAPFKRKFFGYGYTLLAKYFLKLGVSDITCGFKCYKRETARTIFTRQKLNNWSFDAEDIFIARKHGFRIREIPVKWTHKEGSKVKVLQYVFICALDLLRIRYNNFKGLYA